MAELFPKNLSSIISQRGYVSESLQIPQCIERQVKLQFHIHISGDHQFTDCLLDEFLCRQKTSVQLMSLACVINSSLLKESITESMLEFKGPTTICISNINLRIRKRCKHSLCLWHKDSRRCSPVRGDDVMLGSCPSTFHLTELTEEKQSK